MQKVCVFSGKTTDLNTSMNVKLDDGTIVEAWISDEFADSATPKATREAYIKRYEQLEKDRKDLMERAKAMGLVLVDESATPQHRPSQIRVASAETPQAPPSNKPLTEGNKMISGRSADTIQMNPNITMGAPEVNQLVGAGGQEYRINSSDKPSVDLKHGEVAEIGMVKSRGGQVAIPIRRTGPMGITTVRVVENGGDPKLQRRFRDMARTSESGNVSYGKEGYDVQFRPCTMCNRSGIAINGQACPKCNGMGEIEVSRF